MRKHEVMERLHENAEAIRALGVAALYLYGSHARDEARPGSDVDIFVERDPQRMRSLFDLMDLAHLLEGVLGTEVDLGTRTGLHPLLRPEIEQEAIRVL